jgi:DNA-binding NtrC family response regulator
MTDPTRQTLGGKALLVYYSHDARDYLEAALLQQHLEVHSVDGRAPTAVAAIREHSAEAIVLDCSASDVSVSQAVRQIGQIFPAIPVLTMRPEVELVDVYRAGHRVGTAESLEWALQFFASHGNAIKTGKE